MRDPLEWAAHYRKRAAECIELADNSFDAGIEAHYRSLAGRYIKLAEAEEDFRSHAPRAPTPATWIRRHRLKLPVKEIGRRPARDCARVLSRPSTEGPAILKGRRHMRAIGRFGERKIIETANGLILWAAGRWGPQMSRCSLAM